MSQIAVILQPGKYSLPFHPGLTVSGGLAMIEPIRRRFFSLDLLNEPEWLR